MFNNLIESGLHARELRRRGSFLLFTTAVYAVLFITAGVASIYAYDAHLNTDDADELVLLGFVPIEPQHAVVAQPHRTASAAAPRTSSLPPQAANQPVVDRVNPHNVPDRIGNTPSPLPPARGPVPFDPNGPADVGPGGSGGPGTDSGRPPGTGSELVHDTGTPPPPTPTPRPVARTISKPVLNGYAIELPKPPYSAMAVRIRIEGVVQVQVLIDELGKVVSARAVSGHPLLVPDAVRAAYRARFAPTKIGEDPVKVSGVINYNFVLQ